MTTSLAELYSPPTEDEVLEKALQISTLAKLPARAWQSTSVPRAVLEFEKFFLADLGTAIGLIARGGLIDDAEGDWLDLYCESLYQERRKLAGFTILRVVLEDAEGQGPFTINGGDLIVSDATKAYQYENAVAFGSTPANGVLPQNGTLALAFRAQTPGAAYNLSNGAIKELLTSLPGVRVSNPGAPNTSILVQGVDKETDPAYRQRCKDKWTTLATGSGEAAFRFHASSASGEVTRVRVTEDLTTGTVTVTVAGVSGPVTSGALADVDVRVQSKRPLTVKVVTANATPNTTPVVGNVYVSGTHDLTTTTAAVQNAINAYARAVDIGGTAYIAEIVAAAMAVPGVYNFTTTSVDIPLAANAVWVPTFALIGLR